MLRRPLRLARCIPAVECWQRVLRWRLPRGLTLSLACVRPLCQSAWAVVCRRMLARRKWTLAAQHRALATVSRRMTLVSRCTRRALTMMLQRTLMTARSWAPAGRTLTVRSTVAVPAVALTGPAATVRAQ